MRRANRIALDYANRVVPHELAWWLGVSRRLEAEPQSSDTGRDTLYTPSQRGTFWIFEVVLFIY